MMSSQYIRISPWAFDSEVAQIFDKHIRQSIPFYDELHRMICKLSTTFLKDKSTVFDIGTSTGEAILNLSKHHRSLNINYIGIDNSPEMLEKAKFKLQGYKNVQLINSDVRDFTFPKADLILSIYTLQFIDLADRQKIIRNIFRSLNSKGIFIFAEKIISEYQHFEALFRKEHENWKKERGLTDEEISAKRKSLKNVLRPNNLDSNFKILRNCGFTSIETIFKWYNFVCLIAQK